MVNRSCSTTNLSKDECVRSMPNKLRLHLTPQAEDDLESIYHYTTMEWGIEQADLYQSVLYAGMIELLSQPAIGKLYKTKTQDYRTLAIKKHLIYYRQEDVRIVVVRILHGSVDRERWIER